jgi:hypothetical protein
LGETTTGATDPVRAAAIAASRRSGRHSWRSTPLVRANSSHTPSWGKRHSGHDDCCSWERVTCNNVTRRVSHLHLHSVYYNFFGPGAWSLNTTIFAAFPELQFLDLSYNMPIPLSFDGTYNALYSLAFAYRCSRRLLVCSRSDESAASRTQSRCA